MPSQRVLRLREEEGLTFEDLEARPPSAPRARSALAQKGLVAVGGRPDSAFHAPRGSSQPARQPSGRRPQVAVSPDAAAAIDTELTPVGLRRVAEVDRDAVSSQPPESPIVTARSPPSSATSFPVRHAVFACCGHFCRHNLIVPLTLTLDPIREPFQVRARYNLEPIKSRIQHGTLYMVALSCSMLQHLGRGAGLDYVEARKSWLAKDCRCSPFVPLSKVTGDVCIALDRQRLRGLQSVMLSVVEVEGLMDSQDWKVVGTPCFVKVDYGSEKISPSTSLPEDSGDASYAASDGGHAPAPVRVSSAAVQATPASAERGAQAACTWSHAETQVESAEAVAVPVTSSAVQATPAVAETGAQAVCTWSHAEAQAQSATQDAGVQVLQASADGETQCAMEEFEPPTSWVLQVQAITAHEAALEEELRRLRQELGDRSRAEQGTIHGVSGMLVDAEVQTAIVGALAHLPVEFDMEEASECPQVEVPSSDMVEILTHASAPGEAELVEELRRLRRQLADFVSLEHGEVREARLEEDRLSADRMTVQQVADSAADDSATTEILRGALGAQSPASTFRTGAEACIALDLQQRSAREAELEDNLRRMRQDLADAEDKNAELEHQMRQMRPELADRTTPDQGEAVSSPAVADAVLQAALDVRTTYSQASTAREAELEKELRRLRQELADRRPAADVLVEIDEELRLWRKELALRTTIKRDAVVSYRAVADVNAQTLIDAEPEVENAGAQPSASADAEVQARAAVRDQEAQAGSFGEAELEQEAHELREAQEAAKAAGLEVEEIRNEMKRMRASHVEALQSQQQEHDAALAAALAAWQDHCFAQVDELRAEVDRMRASHAEALEAQQRQHDATIAEALAAAAPCVGVGGTKISPARTEERSEPSRVRCVATSADDVADPLLSDDEDKDASPSTIGVARRTNTVGTRTLVEGFVPLGVPTVKLVSLRAPTASTAMWECMLLGLVAGLAVGIVASSLVTSM